MDASSVYLGCSRYVTHWTPFSSFLSKSFEDSPHALAISSRKSSMALSSVDYRPALSLLAFRLSIPITTMVFIKLNHNYRSIFTLSQWLGTFEAEAVSITFLFPVLSVASENMQGIQ